MALQDLFLSTPNEIDEDVTRIDVPPSYRETVDWLPQLGDICPGFQGQSTHGRIDFHAWAEGSWTILMGYPENRAGVSETEVVGIEDHREQLDRRGAKVLGISALSLGTSINWHSEIERLFGISVTTPVICDETGGLCRTFGMQHMNAPVSTFVRRTMIFDPALRLRWMADYPPTVGRSMDEILRILDGLQLFDTHDLGAPMDWTPGDPGIVRPDVSTQTARERYGATMTELSRKIRTVDLPERTAG